MYVGWFPSPGNLAGAADTAGAAQRPAHRGWQETTGRQPSARAVPKGPTWRPRELGSKKFDD